ncbi:MAG: pseudaminic acid synthase [Flavobacteriales bacterium]|nr:pseudaminic acid synthase [Flavobacteriales bacterium]
MKNIQVHSTFIGSDYKPFIIAEMSGNHNQSLERALAIVEAAAEAGAHCIKLQTYTADTITMKGVYTIEDENSLWKGKELHQLYKEAYTPWEWHKPIMDRARELGMMCFSSPFDETAVDFLEELNVPMYKIASFENTHFPLLKKVAQTGKPVIMSTGVITLEDLNESVDYLKKNGCKELILLKCTSTYPASPENTNIITIPDMRERFQVQVGLSDHTMGVGVAVAAVALGATVIEKHFTLDRNDGGVDSAFSLEPHELKSLVIETERAWQSIGKVSYNPTEKELKSLQFKRSIYFSEDLKQGDIITRKNIKVIRPALGVKPKYYEEILGKKVTRDISKGTPVQWDDLQ